MDWQLYSGTLRFSLGSDPVAGFAEREKILDVPSVCASREQVKNDSCIRCAFDIIAFFVKFAVVDAI